MSDHIHAALCTAAVMSGVRDHLQDERIAFDTFLEKWGQGCIELYCVVGELGIKCAELYAANLPKTFPGVFDYEVSEPIGYWIAKQIMEDGDLNRKEAEQKLIDLTNDFFAQGRKQSMKPLVIYHANCTDGFGAAFAAWMKLGDDAEYLPMKHGEVLNVNICDRDVYILDFSFPKPVMDGIIHAANGVIWLDHHKTAFEMWCGEYTKGVQYKKLGCVGGCELDITLDDNKSGALLAWEYFHPDTQVPMVIRHIDDRDRWVFALEGSKEFHAALQLHQPWRFESWKALFIVDDTPHAASFVNMKYTELMSEGRAILRAQEIMVEQQAKQARKCLMSLHKDVAILPGESPLDEPAILPGLALNTQNHISETGHVLANKSGTYGLLWYVGADGKVKCSLRSNGDYDVSAIAKAFGGGGHKNAAGFETDLATLRGWLTL